ncbi:cysteine dioxygenase [Streptomyces sp. NPDC058953]|uniref:cysteine dioxygenase n=1 Tax=unclassified Streptomyces TaxID=2593676 RepID=UPI0036C70AE2
MNNDSDLQIAGDILAVQHLLQPPRRHPSTVADFVGLARAIAADRAQWEGVVEYDATSRWYHRLRTGPGYEVWLLSWVPGQGTGAHDHGSSSGVLTVLEGRLTERSVHPAARTDERRPDRALVPGEVRVFAPGYAHEMVNDALEPAVSLHVYYPALTEMPMHAARCAPAARDVAVA